MASLPATSPYFTLEQKESLKKRKRKRKERKKMQAHLLSLLLLLLLPSPSSSSSLSSDVAALLSFRNSSDPHNTILLSWSPSTTDPCSSSSWLGVSCSLPPSPRRVTRLVLENLALSGDLRPLTSLTALRVLSLKSNRLSGPIPPLSSSLRLLFLSHNSLSGPLPPSLSALSRLYRLDLSFNSLSGPVRSSHFSNLTRLITLRLNSNRLNGTISGLSTLSKNLQDFNVSSNSLSGAIPPSLAASFPASSFANNPGLCGPPLSTSCKNVVSDPSKPRPSTSSVAASPVPPAHPAVVSSSPGAKPEASSRSGGGMSRAAVIAIVVGDFAVLLLVSGFLFCYFWRKFAGRNSLQESEKIVYSSSPYATAAAAGGIGGGGNGGGGFERGKMVFFEGTKRFELEDLLRASAEMLGKGGYGTAYKAVLDDGNVVAVKRLREVGDGGGVRREFEGQMEVIGRLRHPNLVGLKAYYYARDEKLLVYEYMAGGSLFSVLHGNRGPGRTPLDWTTRVRIAAGTARGLAYIHHHGSAHSSSKSKLCHGNIKSTNILLDKSLTPKLADFALFPLFPSPAGPRAHHQHHQGYRAPELVLDPRRLGSQKADVYAFGVLLLEILTGKAAAATAAEESCAAKATASLPQWVQSVVREEWTSEVFDLELMRYKGVEEEMVAVLQVAMACVAAAPEQRPKIGQVLRMIEEIRGVGEGTSPAYESFGETGDDSPCVSDETTGPLGASE